MVRLMSWVRPPQRNTPLKRRGVAVWVQTTLQWATSRWPRHRNRPYGPFTCSKAFMQESSPPIAALHKELGPHLGLREIRKA